MKYNPPIPLITLSLIISFSPVACVTPVQLSQDNWSRPDQVEKVWKTTQNFFLWGLINSSKTVKIYEICPTDYQSIRISRSFVHVLASVLTLGLYVPAGVTVFCRPRPSATVVSPMLLDRPDKDESNNKDEFEEFEQKKPEEIEEIEEPMHSSGEGTHSQKEL